MPTNKSFKSYAKIALLFLMYVVLYCQIVDQGGILPYHMPSIQDHSEYYAILHAIPALSIILMVLIILLYASFFKQIRHERTSWSLFSKCCFIGTLVFLGIVVLGIIAFKQNSIIGTTGSSILFLIHSLRLMFFRLNAVSWCFILIALFPIIGVSVRSKDQTIV